MELTSIDDLYFTNKEFTEKLAKLANGIISDYNSQGIYFALEGTDGDIPSDILSAPNGLLTMFIAMADEVYKRLFNEPLEFNVVIASPSDEDENRTFAGLYVDVLPNEKQNAIIWTHVLSYALEEMVMQRRYELQAETDFKKKANFTVYIDKQYDDLHQKITENTYALVNEVDYKAIYNNRYN